MAKNEKSKTKPAEKPKRKMASKVIRALCIRHPEKPRDKIRAMAEAEVGGKINDITFDGHYLNTVYTLRAIRELGYEIVKSAKAETPAK